MVRSHRDYTIGWICALPLESTAAMAMLDEVHETPLVQDRSDHNMYVLGRVGVHNVAIACLPAGRIGTSSAATVATQMMFSFKNIRFGLMVGIGGGVPSSKYDIRLGDVVVSKPCAGNGGVVQYDFGKTVNEGRFIQSAAPLNSPPTILLNAISNLEARHRMSGNRLRYFLSTMKVPLQGDYRYQGSDNDELFEAEYDHVDGGTCEGCDRSGRLVVREVRKSQDPCVHYGIIASANQVMKHGITRDRLRKEFGMLCFEMEAAGLMNDFPCVVIRGICDYADSHKNKRWQDYAAVTAAAYAKELLYTIPQVLAEVHSPGSGM